MDSAAATSREVGARPPGTGRGAHWRWLRRLRRIRTELEDAALVPEIEDALRRALLGELVPEIAPELTVAECRTVLEGKWCAVAVEQRGVVLQPFHIHRADIDGAIRGAEAATNVLRAVLLDRLSVSLGTAGSPAHQAPGSAPATTTQDADFRLHAAVRALVIAWWNLTAYPPDHPACGAALETAHRRLAALTGASGPLVLGATQKSLLVGGTELRFAHAQKLARALYDRRVALVRLDRGVEAAELERLLRELASDPQEDPAAFWERLEDPGFSHIQVRPVDYAAVRVTDQVCVPAERESLQDRLVRALLARTTLVTREQDAVWEETLGMLFGQAREPADGEATAGEDGRPGRDIAVLIADALREAEARARPGVRAGEAVLVARLAAAVESHLAGARGFARVLAARQTAELVRALPDPMRAGILQAAVRALAAEEGAADALHALSSPFAPDAVLKALERLRVEGSTISRHAMRLAQTLSALQGAATDATHLEPSSADALLSELAALYREEDIDRFNPDDHQALLDHLDVRLPEFAPVAPGSPTDLGDRVESLADDRLAAYAVWTLVELLGRHGWREGADALLSRLESLSRWFLTGGHIDHATTIAAGMRELRENPGCPPELHAALDASLARMAGADALAALVAALPAVSPAAVAGASRLVERLGPVAIENLLVLLVEEQRRSRRRRIFDLLVAQGPALVPPARVWLGDARWYVVRNMIALLRAVGDESSLAEIRRCAVHPDARVCLEALRTLLILGAGGVGDLLERVIGDRDPKVVDIAVSLAEKHRAADAVGPLVRLLRRWDPFGRRRRARVRALRILGELGEPAALPLLRRFLRDWRIPIVALEERRAAFESLEGYPEVARRPLVEEGLGSRDPEIREICERLAALAVPVQTWEGAP